ncbi:hypothetical protein EBR78_03000 [bacterium]|nr:hypothetical protein [bacterium]NBX82743.1 hypothetical protein [bacterium]
MQLFTKWFLIFTFSLIGLAEHAGSGALRQSRPQGPKPCPGYDVNDPFSLNVRYARGPRAGQCMNLFDYRPAHLLTQEEAQQYAAKAELPPPEPGEIWIGNVWHRGKFYVVRVPALAVDDVLFQIERFDPNIPILDFINKRRWFAAHAQVRFKLKKGKEATYIPQKLDDGSPAFELSNVVISSEAVRPKGESFGPLKGNNEHYGLAKRAVSLEEVIDVSVKKLKHQIAQYPIQTQVPKEQVDQVRQNYLLSAITRADRDWQAYRQGKTVFYDTQDRNCLSDAVDIFDEVTDYRGISRGQERVPETRPRELLPALSQRGLLTPGKYPTLNREYGYPNY